MRRMKAVTLRFFAVPMLAGCNTGGGADDDRRDNGDTMDGGGY